MTSSWQSDVVRRPISWRMRQSDVEAFAGRGWHCERRRCREAAVIVAWRWWRSAEFRRVLVTERFLCEQHGAEFAARRRIEIEPPPPPRPARHNRIKETS